MTISPAFATSRPLAGFVSFTGNRDRLIILELYSPLNSDPKEMTPFGNAVANATSRGCCVAVHTPQDNLTARGKTERALAEQAWFFSEVVWNGRGNHMDRFRVYHYPPPAGQQRLFGKERRTGCDIVVVSRAHRPQEIAIRGILMVRHSYNEIMDGALHGTPMPETDPMYAHYLKMFRCTTSVTTRRFPFPTSWKPDDGIEEIDLNDHP